ncbi:metal ABC transporter solute-binding protein, Zn/Mn family [Bacteroidota bacterium]
MKTYFKYFLLLIIILSACEPRKFDQDNRHISVSILPQKYFVEKISGNYFTVNTLVPPGASPATYEPSPRQIKEVSKSVLYIEIGHIGFEQVWMDRMKKINKKMKIIDSSEGVELIGEKQIKHGDHFHEGGVDPHTWMSLKSAKIIAKNTYNAIIKIDSSLSKAFVNNYIKLMTEIDEADKYISGLLKPYEGEKFLIYHPALSYFARDYGLTQIALESEGKNPSPAHVKEVTDIAKKNNVKAIFIQQEFDKENAETLASEIDGKIIQINPLSINWLEEMKITAEKLADAFKLSE